VNVDQLAKLSSSADYTSARYQDLVLQLWHRDTTLDGVAALRAAIGQVARESAEGLRLLIVVEPGASMPPAESRAGIAAFMRDYAKNIRATSLAFEGTGFRAASVRAVVAGLNVLANHPFPYKVFATIGEALWWPPMASRGPGTPPALLAELVERFRAAQKHSCLGQRQGSE
jgi:hypothetical protein